MFIHFTTGPPRAGPYASLFDYLFTHYLAIVHAYSCATLASSLFCDLASVLFICGCGCTPDAGLTATLMRAQALVRL